MDCESSGGGVRDSDAGLIQTCQRKKVALPKMRAPDNELGLATWRISLASWHAVIHFRKRQHACIVYRLGQ